ncbi:MAG: YqgE/AlgH family protein, partial [Luteimonas sp.]
RHGAGGDHPAAGPARAGRSSAPDPRAAAPAPTPAGARARRRDRRRGAAVVALGCAGWGAGQLEYELVENTWLTVAADPTVFFELPLERRWEAAAGLIGVDLMHMADYSGHA